MIYVVTHKQINYIDEVKRTGRAVIQVGFGEQINGCLRDNTGDNIAEKNKSFCELTALYWIWKNCNDEIVGIEHYRRLFVNHIWSVIDRRIPFKARLLTMKQVEKLLNKYDVIMPEKWRVPDISVLQHWNHNHHAEDMVIIEEILQRLYPEYMDDYKQYINQPYTYGGNMFIMRRELLNEYCEFLFTVLSEAEKKVVVSKTSTYQARVFGFLSERLLSIWLWHKKLSIYETQVLGLNENQY